MKDAYCPWCGVLMMPLAMFPVSKDIEWQNCNTIGCKGNRLAIITDELGFVIHPRHIRGRYIYTRPERGHANGKYNNN